MSSSERRRILVGGGLGKISGERRDEFPHHTRSLRQGPGGRRREGTLALGPPRCVPPTASPPLPGRKSSRGRQLAVARARREGRWTGCERGGRDSSGPLCWRWGRWRALSSEVSAAGARTAVGSWELGLRS